MHARSFVYNNSCSDKRGKLRLCGGPGFESLMAYTGLVVFAQSVLRVVIMETTEGVSMGKTKDQFWLFILSMIDVILTIQVNAISSGNLPTI